MKPSKISLGVVFLLLLALALAPTLIWAADTGTVTATVTPKNISVTVSPTSVGYGAVLLNTEASPTGDPVITATNNGSVTENFQIKGATATFGANTWTLSGTANGADQYMHKFAKPAYATYIALTTAYQSLATSVAATIGTQDFKLKILTPTSTSAYGEYSTTVTVLATE